MLGLLRWCQLGRSEEHAAGDLVKEGVHGGRREEKTLDPDEAKAEVSK